MTTDFEASEKYWKDEPSKFSRLYQTWNPMLLAARLFLKQRQDVVEQYLAKHFPRPESQEIFDVGCGSGEYAVQLAGRFKKVCAFDYSPGMLEIARRQTVPTNLEFAQGDCAELPASAASADGLVALGLMDYVSDAPKVLREFARVLKPGGIAVVTFPKSPSLFAPLRWSAKWRGALFEIPPIVNTWTHAELDRLLVESGFNPLERTTLWTTMWIAIAQKN